MNRTDRLLAIVLELQRKGARRAEDLAATFETSKRTIYRDIQALCESGVPVVAQPGVGYSLVEGYFLPPVSFSVDEATMLLRGAELRLSIPRRRRVGRPQDRGRPLRNTSRRGRIPARQHRLCRAGDAGLRQVGVLPAPTPPRDHRTQDDQLRLSHAIFAGRTRRQEHARGRPLRDVALRRRLVPDRPLPPPKGHSQLPARPHGGAAAPGQDLRPPAEFQTRRAR